MTWLTCQEDDVKFWVTWLKFVINREKITEFGMRTNNISVKWRRHFACYFKIFFNAVCRFVYEEYGNLAREYSQSKCKFAKVLTSFRENFEITFLHIHCRENVYRMRNKLIHFLVTYKTWANDAFLRTILSSANYILRTLLLPTSHDPRFCIFGRSLPLKELILHVA